jgi:hypothetical protein
LKLSAMQAGVKCKVKTSTFWCLLAIISPGLLCGCASIHHDSLSKNPGGAESAVTELGTDSLKKDGAGAERVFTKAGYIMWIPSRASHVWDGHTSVVDINKITPPSAFPEEYKIHVDIQTADTVQEIQQDERWASSNWLFQEHPTLATREAPVGLQLRKDVWDNSGSRKLLINAMVEKTDTFAEDVETAKKMIESIKLIPK